MKAWINNNFFSDEDWDQSLLIMMKTVIVDEFMEITLPPIPIFNKYCREILGVRHALSEIRRLKNRILTACNCRETISCSKYFPAKIYPRTGLCWNSLAVLCILVRDWLWQWGVEYSYIGYHFLTVLPSMLVIIFHRFRLTNGYHFLTFFALIECCE